MLTSFLCIDFELEWRGTCYYSFAFKRHHVWKEESVDVVGVK